MHEVDYRKKEKTTYSFKKARKLAEGKLGLLFIPSRKKSYYTTSLEEREPSEGSAYRFQDAELFEKLLTVFDAKTETIPLIISDDLRKIIEKAIFLIKKRNTKKPASPQDNS